MKINKPISITMLFVVTILVVFLFAVPEYKALTSLQTDLAKKQAEYNGKSVYYNNISELAQRIQTNKDGLGKIDSALPSSAYLSPLVYFFQKKAGEAGVAVTSLTLAQVTPPAKDTNIKDIIFTMHVSGTYDNFKNFLTSLDNSSRLFEVNSISFSTPTSLQKIKNQNKTYDFNMEVQTHTY